MNKKFWAFAALCVIIAVAYVVFPFDAIPDLIVVIGWLDDILASILGLAGLTVNVLLALGVIPTPAVASDYGYYGEYQEV